MEIKYESRVIEQLGSELITTDETAIVELLKNAYDAGAKETNLFFLDDLSFLPQNKILAPLVPIFMDEIKTNNYGECIVLEDNGKGMTKKTLQEGFFTIGSKVKHQEKERQKKDLTNTRMILGEKGLGRLAAQRLAPILYIETTSADSKNIYCAKVEWDKIIKKNSDKIQVCVVPNKNSIAYTRLWFMPSQNIEGKLTLVDFTHLLADVATQKKQQTLLFPEYEPDFKKVSVSEKLSSVISFLYSPFEKELNESNDFSIKIWNNDELLKLDFPTQEYMSIAENEYEFKVISTKENGLGISMSMDIKPWYIEHIHFKMIGQNLFSDWKQDPEFYADLLTKYKSRFTDSLSLNLNANELLNSIKEPNDDFIENLKCIAPIKGQVFTFKRDRTLLRMAVESAVKTGNIKTVSVGNQIAPFLNANNGVKLYRGSFRIANLGDKDSDWLHLQQERTKGQQFFRFELGNIIGYVTITDPYQDYITEVTSRQDTSDNQYKQSLNKLLHFVFNKAFYEFNRSAYYITRDILKENNLLPKSNTESIKKEVDKSEVVIKELKNELQSVKSTFKRLQENIEMDNPEKIEAVKEIFSSLNKSQNNFENNFVQTLESIESSKKLLHKVEQREKLIEEDTYNNYKLMANGLITEVLSHELHSILHDVKHDQNIPIHLDSLDKYLLTEEHFEIHNSHFDPVNEFVKKYNNNLQNLNKYYDLLEKTFIYKGQSENIVNENVITFFEEFIPRLQEKLNKNKIDIDFSEADMILSTPKGTLIHVFYNLIDNSIEWIRQKKTAAKYDKSFDPTINKIVIKKVDNTTLHYYDTGLGVSPQYESILFHAMVSGKERGRGMGLYIIRNLLESFGATISLSTERNQYGNRYIFVLEFNKEHELKNESNSTEEI